MIHEPNWKRAKHDAAFRARMATRAKIIAAIRDFFARQGFVEAETPILVAKPGMEPHLEPFSTTVTDHLGGQHQAYLITSPEYSLKKLLAAGYDKVFEITRCFRNGEPWDSRTAGGDIRHNPEFTMIEWYRAQADYRALMGDTEALVADVAMRVLGKTTVQWGDKEIDFAAPWKRTSVREAFAQYAKIDLDHAIDDPAWFAKAAAAAGHTVDKSDTFDDIFFKVFLRDIEPHLGATAPEILYDYPRSMAALSRIKADDTRYAERFEAYCGGIELCNAFSELNDAAEQRARLEEERDLRKKLGKATWDIDEQFIEAVGQMPESAGIALGIDRLVLLLTNCRDIRDVLFFPAEDMFSSK